MPEEAPEIPRFLSQENLRNIKETKLFITEAEAKTDRLTYGEITNLSDHLLKLPTGKQRRFSPFGERKLEQRGYKIIGSLLLKGTREQSNAARTATSERWLKVGLVTRKMEKVGDKFQRVDHWEPADPFFIQDYEIFTLLYLLENSEGVAAEQLTDYLRGNFNPNWDTAVDYLISKYRIGTPERNIPLVEIIDNKVRINPEARKKLEPHLNVLSLLKPRPPCSKEECAYALEIAQRFQKIGERVGELVSSPGFKQALITFWPKLEELRGGTKFVPVIVGNELVEFFPGIVDGRLIFFSVNSFKLPPDFKGYLEEELGFGVIPLGRFKKGKMTGRFSFGFNRENRQLEEIEIVDHSGEKSRSMSAHIPGYRVISQTIYRAEGPLPNTEIAVSATTGKEIEMGMIFSNEVRSISVSLGETGPLIIPHWDSETVKGGQTNEAVLRIPGAEVGVKFSENPGEKTDTLQLTFGEKVKVIPVPKEISLRNLVNQLDKVIDRMEFWAKGGKVLKLSPNLYLKEGNL